MSFFDDVINTGKNVVSTAGKKTDSAVKLSKLKIKETQINNDIRARFEKLGEFIYQSTKSGEKDEDALNEQLAGLNDCYKELEEISKQTDDLKNVVTCPGCGAKRKDEDVFCSICGAKLPEKPKAEEETKANAEAEASDEEDK